MALVFTSEASPGTSGAAVS